MATARLRRRAGTKRAAVWLLLLPACRAAPVADPFETLERSAFFQSTATTPAGVLEVEATTLFDPGSAFESGLALHYGLEEHTEVSSALTFAKVEREGGDARGFGDLVLGFVRRIQEGMGGRPALAFSLEAALPIGEEDPELSSGETSLAAGLIATRPLGWATGNAVYRVTALGDPDESGVLVEHALDLSLATTLAPRLAAFATWSGAAVPEEDEATASLTLGSAVSLSSKALFDFGARFGLDDEAPDVELLVGFTVAF